MLQNRSSSIKFHVMTRSFYFVTFFGKGWSKNSPGYKKGYFLWFSVWVLWLWFCGMIGLFFICDLSKHWFLSNSFAYASSAWFTPFNQLIPWSLQHNMNNTLSSSQRHSKLWFKYVEPEKKMAFLSQLPEESTKQKDGTNGPTEMKPTLPTKVWLDIAHCQLYQNLCPWTHLFQFSIAIVNALVCAFINLCFSFGVSHMIGLLAFPLPRPPILTS